MSGLLLTAAVFPKLFKSLGSMRHSSLDYRPSVWFAALFWSCKRSLFTPSTGNPDLRGKRVLTNVLSDSNIPDKWNREMLYVSSSDVLKPPRMANN